MGRGGESGIATAVTRVVTSGPCSARVLHAPFLENTTKREHFLLVTLHRGRHEYLTWSSSSQRFAIR